MTDILFVIGLIIFIIGGIGFLIATFRTSLLWGLGSLIISPIQIIYLFVHWDSAKKPLGVRYENLNMKGKFLLMKISQNT